MRRPNPPHAQPRNASCFRAKPRNHGSRLITWSMIYTGFQLSSTWREPRDGRSAHHTWVWLRGPIERHSTAATACRGSHPGRKWERMCYPFPRSSRRHGFGGARPGNSASIGFHLAHLPGSLDRLLADSRGESLTSEQLAALAAERTVRPRPSRAESAAGSLQERAGGCDDVSPGRTRGQSASTPGGGTQAAALDHPRIDLPRR